MLEQVAAYFMRFGFLSAAIGIVLALLMNYTDLFISVDKEILSTAIFYFGFPGGFIWVGIGLLLAYIAEKDYQVVFGYVITIASSTIILVLVLVNLSSIRTWLKDATGISNWHIGLAVVISFMVSAIIPRLVPDMVYKYIAGEEADISGLKYGATLILAVFLISLLVWISNAT